MRIRDWSSDVGPSDLPWPFPSSLMIGCFADAQSPELNLDTQELADAFWASRQDVRDALSGTGKFGTAPPYAIAHTLLRRTPDAPRVGQEWVRPCSSRGSPSPTQKQNKTSHTTP